ncbi:MAG: YidH family protein [Vulcanimicrobiaceae bacterium]
MANDNRRISDMLANERTFLAYLRTALSFIAFGFVIARFSLFSREISVVAHITLPNAHAATGFGTAMACRDPCRPIWIVPIRRHRHGDPQ